MAQRAPTTPRAVLNLVEEYGKLQPGKGEGDKLAPCCEPCAVGEVTEWSSGENKCMPYCCCFLCLGGAIVEEMRKESEAKLHRAAGLAGPPNKHKGEAFMYGCWGHCMIAEALAAKRNFERGVHPPSFGSSSSRRPTPSPKRTQVAPAPQVMQPDGAAPEPPEPPADDAPTTS